MFETFTLSAYPKEWRLRACNGVNVPSPRNSANTHTLGGKGTERKKTTPMEIVGEHESGSAVSNKI